jgi:general secretion pathway protein G
MDQQCTFAPSHLRTHLRTLAPSHSRTLRSAFGFTLIELMIVMALIVILAGIGLAVHTNSQTRAREAVLKENLFRMRDALDQYYADKNAYPPTLEDLVSQKYLRAIPEDPFTRSSSTWRTIMSDIDPANPSATPGVFDVKSGSDSAAIDGTRYADW